MHSRFLIPLIALLATSRLFASLYAYPEDKRPAVALNEACEIAETIFAKLGIGKDYFVYAVTIFGDEKQTGDGTCTLMYRNLKGDEIQIGIYFPEDYCIVTTIPKKGESTDKGYTRNGQVAAKWLKQEEYLRKQREEHERMFGPGKSPGSKPTTEQD